MSQDPLYQVARTLVLSRKRASISLLQLELLIGYNRAYRLLEAMEGDVITTPDENGIWHLIIQEGGAA